MGVFNDTIIPFALNGYEMIIASSYPKCTHGIVTLLNKAHIKNSYNIVYYIRKLNKKIYTFADSTRALLTDQFMLFKLVKITEKGSISFMK